jgi:hypothetical protein
MRLVSEATSRLVLGGLQWELKQDGDMGRRVCYEIAIGGCVTIERSLEKRPTT